MAKPVRKRVSEWRERKTQEGGRSLSVWLEADTARMMDALIAEHRGETVSRLVARAISALHGVTCNPAQPPIPEPPAAESPAPEAYPAPEAEAPPPLPTESEPEPAADPTLHEIQNRLALGIPFKQIWRSVLLDWIKHRQKQGASYQTIAEELNAAGIPTLSGKGQWEGGMIPTLLVLNF